MNLAPELAGLLAQVHGEITPEQGLVLAELAGRVSGPVNIVIVEIGSYEGKSTCYLAAGARAGTGHLVCAVDLWTEAPWAQYADPAIQQAFLENVKRLGFDAAVTPIHECSEAAAAHFDHSSVGLLFIDADHTYEAVCADIDGWLPRIAEGGLLVFHDAENDEWGVWRAIRDRLLLPGLCSLRFREQLAICTKEAGA